MEQPRRTVCESEHGHVPASQPSLQMIPTWDVLAAFQMWTSIRLKDHPTVQRLACLWRPAMPRLSQSMTILDRLSLKTDWRPRWWTSVLLLTISCAAFCDFTGFDWREWPSELRRSSKTGLVLIQITSTKQESTSKFWSNATRHDLVYNYIHPVRSVTYSYIASHHSPCLASMATYMRQSRPNCTRSTCLVYHTA